MSKDNQVMEPTEVGFDEEQPSSGGAYLRLKNKGESAIIRIVSRPISFLESFEGKEPQKKFAVKVIHRVTETRTNEVKGFKYGWAIYNAIRDLFKDPEWGDPADYDIKITRTEASMSNFYSVVPRAKKPLSEAEKELVATADVDLVAMYLKKQEEPKGSIAPADDDPFAED